MGMSVVDVDAPLEPETEEAVGRSGRKNQYVTFMLNRGR